jgi:hypothetical protein
MSGAINPVLLYAFLASSGANLTSWETLTLSKVFTTLPLFHGRWNVMLLFTIQSLSRTSWIVSWNWRWRRGRIYLRHVGNHLPGYMASLSTFTIFMRPKFLSERALFNPGLMGVCTISRLSTLLIWREIRTTCSYCTVSAPHFTSASRHWIKSSCRNTSNCWPWILTAELPTMVFCFRKRRRFNL